jgi:C4-dicarboxylate transporter
MSHLDRTTAALDVHARTALRSLAQRVRLDTLAQRARLDVGEGVISAAIVVLIMAILGAAMWALFNDVFTDAGNQIESRVGEIGG